jgi:hypothetical protein
MITLKDRAIASKAAGGNSSLIMTDADLAKIKGDKKSSFVQRKNNLNH